LLSAAGFVMLYVYKDDIAKNMLLSINSSVKGELQVDRVSINPLIHFPNVSISLFDVKYYENKVENIDSLNAEIINISKLYVSFELLELLKSRVEISSVSAENGSIKIIQFPDSSFNITNIFMPPDNTQVLHAGIPSSSDSMVESSSINLSVQKLKLKNIDITIDLLQTSTKQQANLRSATASIKYLGDSLQCALDTKFLLRNVGLDEQLKLSDEAVAIETDFYLDIAQSNVDIYQGELIFANTQFSTVGKMNLSDHWWVDLSFEVNDNELQFTNLFLTSEGLKNIKAGGLYLKGSLQGTFSDQIPELSCSFGAKNLEIQIPNSSQHLKNLSMAGDFISGHNFDLSSAVLSIDTLDALLPSGYIHASANVKNFQRPQISYNLDAAIQLEEVPDVFELGPIENLSGRLILNDKYRGVYSEGKGWMDQSADPFFLCLDSISFGISNVMVIDKMDGSISGNMDSLQIEALQINAANSDFLLNGNLLQLSNFLYGQDQTILANLSVKADHFDFPEIFSFLPKVSQSFPYRINSCFLEGQLQTSYDKLTKFNKTPELNLEIDALSGEIISLLPYAKVKNASFHLYEIDSNVILNFQDLNIDIANAAAEGSFKLYNTESSLDSMQINLTTPGLNPGALFYSQNDTIPDLMDAILKGAFECSITLSQDSIEFMHVVRLSANDFAYFGSDTLSANQATVYIDQIMYDDRLNENPLATLTTTGNIHLGQFKNSIFQSDSLDLQIDAADGAYTIIPSNYQSYGKNPKAKLVMLPFSEPASYSIDYQVSAQPIDEFFASFYEENIFSGAIDLSINLKAEGSDVEALTSSMNGSIILQGDSLMLSGIDLDNIINSFRRSQSFNLVDLGAVALAGPAGIIYSKGSDYAMILSTKKGDSTTISKISSQWSLEEGKITIEDVAVATLENRVAVAGWLDMKSDSLDITVAVVEASGCSIIDQRIYGSGEDPQYSKVKVIKTLLSPVTKVFNSVIGKDCEIFYKGIVQHPAKNSQ